MTTSLEVKYIVLLLKKKYTPATKQDALIAAKSLRLTSMMTTNKLIRAVDSMAILLRTMESFMKLVQTYNL